MSEKFLVVGLGNIGREYAKTRHNVGFWVVEHLAQKHQLGAPTKARKSLLYEGTIGQKRVVLAMPQTYINLSGEAVRALTDFYKLPLERLIVIHDDLDTPLGTLRLRKAGGHGGQNGVRNIIQHLGTEDFARVRFGIGRPSGRMQARDYVLQPFHGDDAILAQQVTERAAEAVELWLQEGIDAAMTAYNGDATAPKPAKLSVDEELAIARRAHELAPNDPKPLEALARAYKRARDLDNAVAAHLKLAELYQALGKPKQMLFEWDNAVRLRPSLVELQARIARENEAQGDLKRATQGWLRLAEHCQSVADWAGAQAALAEALRINPQHPRALAMLDALKPHLTE